MSTQFIHGSCSICGGAVVTDKDWMSTVQQTPYCRNCGATKKQPHGPKIDMEERPPRERLPKL